MLSDVQNDMRNMQLYLCGGELFVKNLRKQVFLQGISVNNIHCDAFTLKIPSKTDVQRYSAVLNI